MAIYRLEKKSISRGSNHNLVAAVAYRAGTKLTDTNKLNPKATTHDYTKKTDVAHSEIIFPDELAQQLTQAGIVLNLEQVANLVERGEATKRGKIKTTAKLASEYVLAGSHELSQAENIQAFQAFAKQQAEEQGVVAMIFVHDPKQGEDMSAGSQAADSQKKTYPDRKKTSDIRNIHAHVIVLSRQLVLSGDKLELGAKSNSELSDTDRKKKGLERSKDWLKGVRKQWADIQNQSLERHKLAPVTHKSYKDLGVKFKPGKHLGKNASHLENMGIKTEVGKHNDAINNYNRQHSEYATSRLIGIAEQRISDSEQRIGYYKQQATRVDRIIASRTRTPRPNPFDEQYRASVNRRKQRAAELDESASRHDQETEYYRYEFESASERLIEEVIQEFLTRSPEKYNERQLKALEYFAEKNNLTLEHSKDYRDYLRKSQAFFKTMSLSDNEQIIKLLRDPHREWLEHEKTNDGLGFSASESPKTAERSADVAKFATPKRSFRP
ncbi:MobA/MobL family protein [Psychrobacter alimentarius]|uniref:MobA/MobL family protein n=1 Tax=Psychrobacter alimentarius TaxID=261164 RepID=UPI0019195AC6|nr:MobA/MobL family protein [Psychrobacter alimentarius]